MAGMIIKLNHLHRETNSSFQPLSLVFTRLVLLALLCLAPLSLSCKGGRAALGSAGHVEAKRTSGAEPDEHGAAVTLLGEPPRDEPSPAPPAASMASSPRTAPASEPPPPPPSAAPAVSPASEAQDTSAGPCAVALDEEHGAMLLKAVKLVRGRPKLPADSTYYLPAVAAAEKAVELAPDCGDAWSALAVTHYWAGYDICGRGRFDKAKAAANRGLELTTEPKSRAQIHMTLARIALAEGNWSQGRANLEQVLQANPGHGSVKIWLGTLDIRDNPGARLIAAANKIIASEALSEKDLSGLSKRELSVLLSATLARQGRRLNSGTLDWFYFCEGSPLANRPRLDPSATRSAAQAGTVDHENRKLLVSMRKNAS